MVCCIFAALILAVSCSDGVDTNGLLPDWLANTTWESEWLMTDGEENNYHTYTIVTDEEEIYVVITESSGDYEPIHPVKAYIEAYGGTWEATSTDSSYILEYSMSIYIPDTGEGETDVEDRGTWAFIKESEDTMTMTHTENVSGTVDGDTYNESYTTVGKFVRT